MVECIINQNHHATKLTLEVEGAKAAAEAARVARIASFMLMVGFIVLLIENYEMIGSFILPVK